MAVKTKTPEEILKRIHEGTEKIPPQPHVSFDPLTYVNTQTKILFVDAEHGSFEAKPMDVLRGIKKHPRRLKIQRGLPAADVQAEVIRIHPYMRLDESTYTGLSAKARFVDEKFGEYWAEPQHVIKHHQSKHPRRDAFIRALPTEEVQRRITEGYLKNPPRSFITLDPTTYESVDKKARFIDSEFGEWWAFPNNIMKGQCHPKRTGNPVYTIEDIKRILSNRPEITMDESTFVNVTTKARFIDKDYGEWWCLPQTLILGLKKGNKKRLYASRVIPAEEIIQRIQKTRPYITMDKETYKGSLISARFIDEKYGEWWSKPNSVLMGHGHPRAFSYIGLETKVEKLLGIPSFGYVPDFLQGTRIKPDFKISEDIYLEADGIYWHSELKMKRKSWHLERRELFEKHGKRLFQFREDEILIKPTIVKSIVENSLNLSTRIFARKCLLREDIPLKDFLNNNHLMGTAPGTGLALYNDGKIVAALSYKLKGKELHIVRFCTATGIAVVGGFSKLLKKAMERTQPARVINFVDLRYGTGKHLESKGFKLEGITLGWNWTDGKNTFNRLKCRANMDSRKLSQREHAEELGLYKIYDAGQAKYVLEIEPHQINGSGFSAKNISFI
jgi:hypothetical protein